MADVPEVVVSAGRESVRVVGPAAAIIAQIMRYAEQVNQIPVGSATIDWAQGKASLRLTASFEAVRFELDHPLSSLV